MRKQLPSPNALIEVKDLVKTFSVNQRIQPRFFREDLRSLSEKIIKKFSTVKNQDNSKSIESLGADRVYALNGVSLSVSAGEIIGITGANGSGKSTFLKILARTLYPSSGSALTQGRVLGILNGSGGFQPEMTGKDNIFLIGQIMGMSKAEIQKKFDAIVGFSGIEKFLHMPIKFYSTGMNSRLTCSVVFHMESDILLLDEVLANSDTTFFKNCVQKTVEMAKQGTAVLLISHDMVFISKMCTRTLIFSRGSIVEDGETQSVISRYLSKPPPLEVSA